MKVIKEKNGEFTITEITKEDSEVIVTAVLRILNDLPCEKQPSFRRLAMDLDK